MSPTEPPEPIIEENRPTENRRRVSAVWLVPLAALIISLAVAWRTYSERGPVIEIVFEDAAGIVAGQTRVRFRNMDIGLVEGLAFTDDLRQVVASARIDRDLSRYVDENSQFWAVRPQVTTQGVSGIETVLSGVYIEAYIDDETGPRAERFTALPRPPLTPADQPGLRVRLRAPDGGSLNIGAPVLYKRIQVGQVENVELTDAGDVTVDLFVDAPHHLRLTTATRFWNISGFSIDIGAGGASLNVDSLLTLVQGGVAFDTITTGGEAVETGHAYQLYASETTARQSVVEEDPAARLAVSVFFDGSVRGLQPGAAVEFRGIRVGEVSAIQTVIEGSDNGEPVARTRTTLDLAPSRFGLSGESPRDDLIALLEARVDGGLRAQLASASLITGALLVDLVDVPEVEPASFDAAADPHPILPSTPSEIAGFAASAEGVLDRVANLPIEDILDGVVTLIANVNTLVTDDRIRAAPENLGLLLADLRELVGSEEVRAAPAELAALLASARAVVDEASEERLVASLTRTLDEASRAAEQIGTASEGLPALVANLEALTATAADLPFEDLVTATTGLVGSLDGYLDTPGMEDLPASLAAAITELRLTAEELREGGAVANLNATLASADEAAAAVRDAMATLPELLDTVATVASRADAAIASLGPDSAINRDTQILLRELRDSARAVTSLVTSLERRPNSILFGR
jgi:paraquat-inducible protein B